MVQIHIQIPSHSNSSYYGTDRTVHEAWNNQIKRIMQWTMEAPTCRTIDFVLNNRTIFDGDDLDIGPGEFEIIESYEFNYNFTIYVFMDEIILNINTLTTISIFNIINGTHLTIRDLTFKSINKSLIKRRHIIVCVSEVD